MHVSLCSSSTLSVPLGAVSHFLHKVPDPLCISYKQQIDLYFDVTGLQALQCSFSTLLTPSVGMPWKSIKSRPGGAAPMLLTVRSPPSSFNKYSVLYVILVMRTVEYYTARSAGRVNYNIEASKCWPLSIHWHRVLVPSLKVSSTCASKIPNANFTALAHPIIQNWFPIDWSDQLWFSSQTIYQNVKHSK